MEEGQDTTKTGTEHIGLQKQFPADPSTMNSVRPQKEAKTVFDIVRGLGESLKNVQKYRLSVHEEIEDILKNRSRY